MRRSCPLYSLALFLGPLTPRPDREDVRSGVALDASPPPLIRPEL